MNALHLPLGLRAPLVLGGAARAISFQQTGIDDHAFPPGGYEEGRDSPSDFSERTSVALRRTGSVVNDLDNPIASRYQPAQMRPIPTATAGSVAAAKAGDRTAREHLYRAHVSYVVGLSTRVLRHREDALETTQDAFIQAFANLASLDDPEAFQAWVGTIAVRLCHRRLRRRKIVAFLGFGDQTADDFTDERVALAWRPDRTLELGALERQLQKLAAPERTAWLLRYVEGETLEAVAALCHCSLATAKRWIRSANDSLKEVVPDVSDL